MSGRKTIPAVNGSSKSATSIPAAFSQQSSTSKNSPLVGYPTAGFGQFDLRDLIFVDPVTRKTTVLAQDYREALTDIIYSKSMIGVTTLTLQCNDPNRTLLRNVIKQGTEITINDSGTPLTFAFSQITKASDQIQLVFESIAVYRLRNQRNPTGSVTTKVSTGVTEFMASLVGALNYPGSKYSTVKFVGPDYATVWSQLTGNAKAKVVSVGLGRGTKTDPYEDSWTCMTRLASSVGWRLWENNNTVYFGPDEYWLGLLTKDAQGFSVPPINNSMGTLGRNLPVLKEFGLETMFIDYDWDVQKPFGQATVTAMLDRWQYDIGEIAELSGMGPGDGNWMIFTMQRDLFMPQATITLQVPMPFASVYDPTSLPLPGLPLITKLA
jgi:hypothetical protein